jgi:hypothetical protein
VIAMISNDPVLGDVKLIAEAWDAGGLYQVGSFPHYGKWAEWNGRFRDDARNFIRGFDGYAGLFAECICGSPSLYKDTGRKPYHSLNFITAHDGFTLRDLVSYNEKHNDANGENNQDGEENNQSWNCGLGPHEDGDGATPVAKVLRDRQMRNFFAALFVSQGTPMVYQGDEYGHTKGGNNNTYCHDNALNWVDWDAAKDPVKNAGLSRFARLMRQFKARQPALRLMDFPNENNIKWHGNEPNEPSWDEENRFVAFTVQSHDPGREIGLGKSEQIYCAFNAYHLPAKVVLPNPPDGCAWRLVADTALQPPYDFLDADDIPAQSKAAAEAMLKPQLASNCYTVMDRASVIIRAERVKPLPVPEPEPEPEPAADDCEAHAAEAEQVQQETPSPEAPEAPEGVESPASVFDDFEDAFEKAFDASAEFVVRQFEPAPREPLAASSPPGFVAEPSPCSRADEVEQRARRAAASEADAWTAAEVPTLFKLSEKASSREERRKWEIILDVVLARAAAKSPSPLPAPSGSEPVFSPDVSPGAKKKRRASPVADRTETETLPFENKKQKRRRVDARAENVAYASSESAGGDAGPVADPVADAAAGPADDSDDEMASLERRLRSMRTTRKERAEMEIAAMHKQFKEDTHAQAAALEAEAARAEKAAAARRAQAEEKNKKRVARVVDAFAAQHQTFKDAARDAREALEEVEAAYARDLEEAAATTEAERAKLAKRAETLVARAAARAEETSRVVAKKRKDAATGNSLKSLLLRLAEQM